MTLPYSDIGRQKQLKKTYGTDVMSVTVKQSSKLVLKIPYITLVERDIKSAS